MNYAKQIIMILSTLSLAACSQTNFSTPDSSQSGSISSSSSGMSSSSSFVGQASLPKSSCVNSSTGAIGFKLASSSSDTFQTMKITSLPSNPNGYLEAYTIHDNGSGSLAYELQSMDVLIDDDTDDYFYSCLVDYSEISEFALKKGISSFAAAIPRLSLQIWLYDANPTAAGKIVGLAIQNPQTKEFAVQCY